MGFIQLLKMALLVNYWPFSKRKDTKTFVLCFVVCLERCLIRNLTSEVWETTKEILVIHKLEPHCYGVSGSPVDSELSQKDFEGSSSDRDEEDDCLS